MQSDQLLTDFHVSAWLITGDDAHIDFFTEEPAAKSILHVINLSEYNRNMKHVVGHWYYMAEICAY